MTLTAVAADGSTFAGWNDGGCSGTGSCALTLTGDTTVTASFSTAGISAPVLEWQYGGFVDVGYLRDFNHPSNRLFRSRGTAFHVDEWDGRGVRQEEGVRAVSMGH